MKPKLTSILMVVFVFFTTYSPYAIVNNTNVHIAGYNQAKETKSTLKNNQMAQEISFPAISDQVYGTDFSFIADCESVSCDPIDMLEISADTEPNTWNAHIKKAGTVKITAHTESESSDQTIIIQRATLTITADDKERIYFTANPEWTAAVVGLKYDDTIESLDFTLTCEAERGNIIGLYPIVITLGENPNYEIAPTNGWLRINPAPQDVFGFSDNLFADYGDSPKWLNIYVSSRSPVSYTSLNPDVVEIKNNQAIFKSAGSTKIIVSVLKNINYEDIEDLEINVTIAKAPLTLTGRKVVMQYGDDPYFIQLQDSFDVNGWKNNDDNNLLASVRPYIYINESITSSTPPGYYPEAVVLVGIGLLTNYSLHYIPGDLEILKTQGTITFNPIASMPYSGTPFPLPATHSAEGNIRFESNDPDAFEFIYDDILQRWNAKILKTGNYNITAIVDATSYYDYCETSQLVTITKAPLYVTAINEVRFYGEENSKLNLIYTCDGFVYPKDKNEFISLPEVSINNSEYGTDKPVGIYPGAIVVSGGEHPNYNLIYQNGTLEIMSLEEAIVFQPLSARTYGEEPFNLNATHYGHNPVRFRSNNENVIRTYIHDQQWKAEITGAGTAEITAYTDDGNGYIAAELTQSITINKAPLTIRPRDAVRPVGTPNPGFSLLFTGLRNGDDSKLGNIIISCTANESSPAGEYDIVASNAANPNYIITYEKGTLLVTDLTIHELDINGAKIPTPTHEVSFTASCLNGQAATSLNVTIKVSTTVLSLTLWADDVEKGTVQPGSTGGVCKFRWDVQPGAHIISVRLETSDLDGNTLSETYTIHLTQPLNASANLFYQRWNNVLAINNNPEINGGFSFKSYSWYKNDVQLPSSEGFIKEPATIDPQDEYWVELTTIDDTIYKTCPAKFAARSAKVAVYPSVAAKGGTVTVNAILPETDQTNAQVKIFNVEGKWINTILLEGTETRITMPEYSGQYVLHVITDGGLSQQFKVIVF